MTNQEAIAAIRANFPPENYSILREALLKAIDALGGEEPQKECTYYEVNKTKPYCTHDCNGCMWVQTK